MLRKRLLVFSLVLALLLVVLAPATALARGWSFSPRTSVNKFSAVFTPTSIDDTIIGTTWPVRDSADTSVWPIIDIVDEKPTVVGWIIDGRSVYGDVNGDIDGSASFTYGGILDTLQSGSMQGVLAIETAKGTMYLAASGSIGTEVTDLYTLEEIVAWWSVAGGGLPLGVFFAQMYNTEALALLPDGELSFEGIQAWCGAIGLTVGQFFAGIYGTPPELDDATLAGMYGTMLPPLQGLQLFGGMYGDTLTPLPQVLNAEFEGTLRVDAGTGAYGNISGTGKFGPANREPLTLHVSPAQHVDEVEGAIALSGKYKEKRLPKRPKLDKGKLDELIDKWHEHSGQNWQDD